MKARIAQEHPLLVFSKLPSHNVTDGNLSVGELFEHGRSWEYADLPNLVWATTGYRLPKLKEFQEFGRLRNQIVHFAVPNLELSIEALRFCIEVMEPIIDEFWKETAIHRAEEWDEVIVDDGYLEKRLIDSGIVIPECVKPHLRPA